MKANHDLVLALTTACGGRLLVGDERTLTLRSGELEVEVTVTVRRHNPPAEATALRDQALQALRERTYLLRRCSCSVTRKSPMGGRYEADCSGRVVAVVVYQRPWSTGPQFAFVCGRHREAHRIERKDVLAVVNLAETLLAPIRAQAEVDHAARVEKHRQEWERMDKPVVVEAP